MRLAPIVLLLAGCTSRVANLGVPLERDGGATDAPLAVAAPVECDECRDACHAGPLSTCLGRSCLDLLGQCDWHAEDVGTCDQLATAVCPTGHTLTHLDSASIAETCDWPSCGDPGAVAIYVCLLGATGLRGGHLTYCGDVGGIGCESWADRCE
jgi:hypothetical protein